MAVVLKFFKTIRNNWKKTVFFSGVAAYGAHYGKGVYEDNQLRKAFCEEARKIGEEPLRLGERARKVTVFLNPAANNGGSRKIFEKNVAPILYLAGIQVNVVKTEYEGQAKKYMDVLDDADAVVVAGGDGTLAEVVTGLLRRSDQAKYAKEVPIGFIPLGMTNTLSRVLYDQTKTDVGRLLEAAWSIVVGTTKPLDVMAITGEEEGEEKKTVYALSSIEWGSFREAELQKPRFKIFRSFKHRLAYFFSSFGEWPPVVTASLNYSSPCDGCSTCFTPPPEPVWKWWHIFLPPRIEVPKIDYSQVTNEECGKMHSKAIKTMEFSLTTRNSTSDPNKQKGLNIVIGPETMRKSEFIKEGSKRHLEGRSPDFGERLSVQKVKLVPGETQKVGEGFITIDSEQFELMPMEVELLKNKVSIFTPDRTILLPASPAPS